MAWSRRGLVLVLAGVCATAVVAQEPEAPVSYSKNCGTCHGKTARGANGPALVPYDSELSELLTVVRQGIGMMPAMSREEVSDAEVEEIYNYLRAVTAATKK